MAILSPIRPSSSFSSLSREALSIVREGRVAILSVVVEKQRVAILSFRREGQGVAIILLLELSVAIPYLLSSIILSILLEKQEGVILCLDSQEASCGHPLAHSSLLFSPLFLERPSPSFEREGMAILSVLLEKQRVAILSFR